MFLTFCFVQLWGANGIATAYATAGLVSITLQTIFLRRRVGPIRGSEIKDSVLKCMFCCAVMFLVTKAGMIVFEHNLAVDTKRMQFLEVLILIAIGGLSYFTMALFLHMEELTSVLSVVKRKLKH